VVYQALSVVLGTLKGTPLQALEIEAGEMPLDLRRKLLSQKFRISLYNNANHPLYGDVQDCWQFYFNKLKTQRPSFGKRTIDFSKGDSEIPQTITFSPFPPWQIQMPTIISTELKEYFTKSDNPLFLHQKSLEIINTKWKNYMHAYTDGSKVPDSGHTACAFYIPYFKILKSKRLQNKIAIYRAELTAIILCLDWINEQNVQLYTGLVIFSDSLSAIQAIKNSKEESMVTEILVLCTHLSYKGININFEWIPSHCGIIGNDKADLAAKHATTNPEINVSFRLNKSEIKSDLKKHFSQIWESRWEESNCFLSSHHKKALKTFPCKLKSRKDIVTLYRLRSGNIGLNTDLKKIGKHETGLCHNCNVPETLQHYITECSIYLIPRAMLQAELNKEHLNDILPLLTSEDLYTQKALTNYVHRTKRFARE